MRVNSERITEGLRLKSQNGSVIVMWNFLVMLVSVYRKPLAKGTFKLGSVAKEL